MHRLASVKCERLFITEKRQMLVLVSYSPLIGYEKPIYKKYKVSSCPLPYNVSD